MAPVFLRLSFGVAQVAASLNRFILFGFPGLTLRVSLPAHTRLKGPEHVFNEIYSARDTGEIPRAEEESTKSKSKSKPKQKPKPKPKAKPQQ